MFKWKKKAKKYVPLWFKNLLKKKETKSKIYSKVLGVQLSDDVFFPRPTSILEAERGITENRKIQTAVTFFLPKPAQVITNMR